MFWRVESDISFIYIILCLEVHIVVVTSYSKAFSHPIAQPDSSTPRGDFILYVIVWSKNWWRFRSSRIDEVFYSWNRLSFMRYSILCYYVGLSDKIFIPVEISIPVDV